jgi:putative ATP-dependent endonuclease of OLD family
MPDDADPELEGEDELPEPPDLDQLQTDHVHVFKCATTFERAVTIPSTLEMLASAAEDIGAPLVAKKLRKGIKALQEDGLTVEDRRAILDPLRDSVLNTAIRFGKARFAQVAARHVDKATTLPKYIADALDWLTED